MITLDKIKIIAPIESIRSLKEEYFKVEIKNSEVVSYSFTQTTPFLLYIEKDIEEQEAVFEFTGKILLDDYPKLISKDTFKKCLEHIGQMGICDIDFDCIINQGEVSKIDITKDIPLDDCPQISEYLRTHLTNHKKYLSRSEAGNLIIEKNVKTKGCKRRLTIYDKQKEINKACNQDFLLALNDSNKVLDYFQGKARFELNLNSKEAIRKSLNIPETTLSNVFESSANPIVGFIDDVIQDDELVSNCASLTERKNLAFLKDCDMDIKKVEAEIRTYASKGTHISQALKPYRQLLDKLNNNGQSPRIKSKLCTLLAEILVIVVLFPLYL
ncbi:MAG: phage/plasmid replication protein [Bacteroidales bacterium]|nr:phage/plasmid replication protein [Bacteroidales bacterium]